jgi:hypothetical protein
MENVLKNKLKAMVELRNSKIEQQEQVMEIYVKEIGWLVLLLDDVEVVTDNWFTSTKYSQTSIEHDESSVYVTLKNVYVKNQASLHTDSNPKYNLIFDEIMIFADHIIACL